MDAIRCPRCKVQATIYNAPVGKVVRNPEAGLTNAVHDDCKACNGTGYIPGVVLDSITKFARDPVKAKEYAEALHWNYDHFGFKAGGMYVGVECDGYLHT